MKKIILTESQSKKLINKIINEQTTSSVNDERMTVQVQCNFDYYNLPYKGGDIDSISDMKINLSFLIGVEWRSYGIKSISVYDIRGPESIEAWIRYYPEGKEDYIEDAIELKLDWNSMLQTKIDESLGWIGISDEITIVLSNDQQGNLIVSSIEVDVKGF